MSKRFIIVNNIEVKEFDAEEEWGYAKHNHNFFELTFILKGSGSHILNDNTVNYKEGDVFFLTPKDEHEFVVNEPSKFGIIKFTEQLFLEKASFTTSTQWRKNLETVIFHSNVIAESIVNYESDKAQLFGLYQLIKNELEHTKSYNRIVLTELFGALLVVISRNLKSSLKSINKEGISDKERIEEILTYVRQHVLDKELMTIKSIANVFYMSPNYVSVYIKKHVGISLQQYVLQTKLQISQRLLKQTSLSINNIATKMGFIDASHFNKFFKKHKGENPSDYRKDNA